MKANDVIKNSNVFACVRVYWADDLTKLPIHTYYGDSDRKGIETPVAELLYTRLTI